MGARSVSEATLAGQGEPGNCSTLRGRISGHCEGIVLPSEVVALQIEGFQWRRLICNLQSAIFNLQFAAFSSIGPPTKGDLVRLLLRRHYGLTTFSGLPARNARTLATAVSSSRCRAARVAQAMCGVMQQFFA